MNKERKFNTSINCSGCVATVKPHLDQLLGEKQWEVDINNPLKPLTVSNEKVSDEEVVKTVEKAGFRISASTVA